MQTRPWLQMYKMFLNSIFSWNPKKIFTNYEWIQCGNIDVMYVCMYAYYSTTYYVLCMVFILNCENQNFCQLIIIQLEMEQLIFSRENFFMKKISNKRDACLLDWISQQTNIRFGICMYVFIFRWVPRAEGVSFVYVWPYTYYRAAYWLPLFYLSFSLSFPQLLKK